MRNPGGCISGGCRECVIVRIDAGCLAVNGILVTLETAETRVDPCRCEGRNQNSSFIFICLHVLAEFRSDDGNVLPLGLKGRTRAYNFCGTGNPLPVTAHGYWHSNASEETRMALQLQQSQM